MSDNMMDENDDEELIAVEDDEEQGQHPEPEDDEDDDEDEDARLSESQDDLDDEVSSRNRKKRTKRRDLQKAAKENAQREIRALREQNDLLMRRMQAVEGNALTQNVNAIDQRLNEAVSEAQQAERIVARAVEAGNGDDVVTAMRMRDEAKERAGQLYAAKQQVEQAKVQISQPTADPRVTNLAKEWIAANPWYDPQGRDEDSAITKAIDNQLVREGYDPASYEYWTALTERVSARIGNNDPAPSRDAGAPRRKAPPIGNTREHAPVSTKKEVYVTPARKQAMIDAGVWDDPTKRNQMLKAYQAYDRNSAR
jgi:hypothetical protein